VWTRCDIFYRIGLSDSNILRYSSEWFDIKKARFKEEVERLKRETNVTIVFIEIEKIGLNFEDLLKKI
jgi:hypothetical protein